MRHCSRCLIIVPIYMSYARVNELFVTKKYFFDTGHWQVGDKWNNLSEFHHNLIQMPTKGYIRRGHTYFVCVLCLIRLYLFQSNPITQQKSKFLSLWHWAIIHYVLWRTVKLPLQVYSRTKWDIHGMLSMEYCLIYTSCVGDNLEKL